MITLNCSLTQAAGFSSTREFNNSILNIRNDTKLSVLVNAVFKRGSNDRRARFNREQPSLTVGQILREPLHHLNKGSDGLFQIITRKEVLMNVKINTNSILHWFSSLQPIEPVQ